MNTADIVALVIIVVFAGLGALMGFTRGLFSFFGVYFGAKFAASMTIGMQGAAGGGKYLQVFIGIALIGIVVGFLFYGATKFQPMEALDSVFGAVFGLMMGWGIAHAIFHYYLFFNNANNFAVQIYNGQLAMAVHDVAPWQNFMNRMERFRKPDLDSPTAF